MSSIISRRRHPAAGYAAIAGGLVVVGAGSTAALAGGGASAASPAQDTTQTSQGHSLFVQSCATCHGLDAQGTSVAPSLIGAGAAAVDFQMSTGRMPAKELGAENDRKPSDFTPAEIYDIASYISSLGGGPSIPAASQVSTAGANTALGQVLFSTNCAQCHGFAGAGGALTYGKTAPSLNAATPTQIYEAMLTGPEAMPVFDDGAVTPPRRKTSSPTSSTRGTRPTPAASRSAAPVPSPRACWPGSAALASSCSSPCGLPPSGRTEWSTSERMSSDE